MGLLDGGLQRVVSGVFRGLLLPGYLHRPQATRALSGKVLNAWAAPRPIRGCDAAVTEQMVRAAGYTADDVQLIVLQIDGNGVAIEPKITTADRVEIRGIWHAPSLISADPAKGAWIMRGTPVEAPPAGG